jgi:hypothetical protein
MKATKIAFVSIAKRTQQPKQPHSTKNRRPNPNIRRETEDSSEIHIKMATSIEILRSRPVAIAIEIDSGNHISLRVPQKRELPLEKKQNERKTRLDLYETRKGTT